MTALRREDIRFGRIVTAYDGREVVMMVGLSQVTRASFAGVILEPSLEALSDDILRRDFLMTYNGWELVDDDQ